MNGKGDTYRPTYKERFDTVSFEIIKDDGTKEVVFDTAYGFNNERFIHEVEGNSIKVKRIKSDQTVESEITIDDKW